MSFTYRSFQFDSQLFFCWAANNLLKLKGRPCWSAWRGPRLDRCGYILQFAIDFNVLLLPNSFRLSIISFFNLIYSTFDLIYSTKNSSISSDIYNFRKMNATETPAVQRLAMFGMLESSNCRIRIDF